MDFGATPELDGLNASVPAAALRLGAWFERSGAELSAAGERFAEGIFGGLLDRFREADGLMEE